MKQRGFGILLQVVLLSAISAFIISLQNINVINFQLQTQRVIHRITNHLHARNCAEILRSLVAQKLIAEIAHISMPGCEIRDLQTSATTLTALILIIEDTISLPVKIDIDTGIFTSSMSEY